MKRIISILLCALMLCTAFMTGCKDNSDSDSEQSAVHPDTNMALLNGFEDFERDVQLLHLLNRFGSADMNKDKDYIRSGNGSLKIRPLGHGFSTAVPTLVAKTYSTRFEFGYTDFSKVDKVIVSVYNAEEFVVRMGMSLVLNNGTMNANRLENMPSTTTSWYYLNSGWNEVALSIDDEYLECQDGDVNIDSIYGIAFKFDSQLSFDVEDAPTLYLDDLYLHYNQDKAIGDILLNNDQTNGYYEVAALENANQFLFFTANAPFSEMPDIEIVSANDVGLIVSKGNMLLKFSQKASIGENGYSYLYFSSKIFKQAVNSIADIKINPDKYVFKFDVYNATENVERIAVDFAIELEGGGRTWCATNSYTDYSDSIKGIPAGGWMTYEYNFKSMNDAYAASHERQTLRQIVTLLESERENGKAVTLSSDEQTQMLTALNMTMQDVTDGLANDDKITSPTADQISDYIFKRWLYNVEFSVAKAKLLEKKVMLTNDMETQFNRKGLSVVEKPYQMRMLFSKYYRDDCKDDKIFYFDNFRIEKITEA